MASRLITIQKDKDGGDYLRKRQEKRTFAVCQFEKLQELGIVGDDAFRIVDLTTLSLAVPAVEFCRQVVREWRRDWEGSDYTLYRTIAGVFRMARTSVELEKSTGAWINLPSMSGAIKDKIFPWFVLGCIAILEHDLGLSFAGADGSCKAFFNYGAFVF